MLQKLKHYCIIIVFLFVQGCNEENRKEISGNENEEYFHNYHQEIIDSLIAKGKVLLREKNDSSFFLLDSAYKLARKSSLPKTVAQSSKLISDYYFKNEEINKALEYNEEAIRWYRKTNDSVSVAQNMIDIANVYITSGAYDKALVYSTKALEIFRNKNEKEYETRVINNIGIIYGLWDDTTHAIWYYKKAIDLAQQLGMERELQASKLNISIIYLNNKQYYKAIKLLKEVQINAKQIGFIENYVFALVNLGALYIKTRDYVEAKNYLLKALPLLPEISNKKVHAFCFNKLGELENLLHNYAEAEVFLLQSLEISKKNYFKPDELNTYISLADLYRSLNDCIHSDKYQRKAFQLKDELLNREIIENTNKIKTRFEFYNLQNELKIREAEVGMLHKKQEVNELRLALLLIALVLVMAFLFLLYIYFQQKAKLNKLRNAEVEKMLECKINEVSIFGAHILKTKKLLETIKVKIKKLRLSYDSGKPVKNEIGEIIAILSHSEEMSNNQVELYKRIDELSEFFYINLEDRFPGLTENEKQLCAMIRLGFSSKQIAMLNNIQPASIDIARYRLRKKMNLDANENFYDFLKKLRFNMM
ncbi:MAG: tetratricopeptide repeat protein [Bacteroidales bacterium]|nr:tetratricopeptide repeat protein [Bacteroidales bacterium]MCF8387796.1 tetratricopeptide repeat protein [Bacteroidales bacterium]MCF8398219.1 tetratricopeptide repeat protein [Bacteroidales bacterium]